MKKVEIYNPSLIDHRTEKNGESHKKKKAKSPGENERKTELQPWTKYLRQTLVLM